MSRRSLHDEKFRILTEKIEDIEAENKSIENQYKQELAEKTLQLQAESEKVVKAEERNQELEIINDMLEEERKRLLIEKSGITEMLQSTNMKFKQALEDIDLKNQENEDLQKRNRLLKQQLKDVLASRSITDRYNSSPNLLQSHSQDQLLNGQRTRAPGREKERERALEEKNVKLQQRIWHLEKEIKDKSFKCKDEKNKLQQQIHLLEEKMREKNIPRRSNLPRSSSSGLRGQRAPDLFPTHRHRSSPNLCSISHSQDQLFDRRITRESGRNDDRGEEEEQQEQPIYRHEEQYEGENSIPPRRWRGFRSKCIIL